MTQRAEVLVAGLALLVGLAVVGVLVLTIVPDARGHRWITMPTEWGAMAIGFAGLLVVGLVAGASSPGTRPLGLLWDLICFLPRAGHPIGPPCYAERAVPEIVARVQGWLEPVGDVAPAQARKRRVVLSAHSLGSVLATAALFRLRPDDGRVSLLSYGSQLRVYFARLMPELLGADVLGVTESLRPRLTGGDPWLGEIEAEEEDHPPAVTGGDSLVGLLTVRGSRTPLWRSLWRRTDYIGFPVCGYLTTDNPVDRAAGELDQTDYFVGVLTHSDYPRVDEYTEALRELVAGMPDGS